MPEAPEIETIRRTHESRLLGLRISSIWRSEFRLRTLSTTKDFAFLIGDRIESLSRFAKVLIIETDRHRGILMRFGMSGRLFAEPVDSALPKHTHLRIQFENSDFELRFIDARRFGDLKVFHDVQERDAGLFGLGPDGLSLTKVQIKEIAKRIHESARAIKVILLDQSILSGVGNIYASEALYLVKISPLLRGCDLTLVQIAKVLEACMQVMLKAVENKGTTFLSYVDGNGDKGGNQHHLAVFDREGEACERCGKTILRVVQAQRSTFYCPKCQG